MALPPVGLHGERNPVILAIDPGRDKCGWVFASEEGKLVASGIFSADRAAEFFRRRFFSAGETFFGGNMLDLKLCQKHPEVVAKALADRNSKISMDDFGKLFEKLSEINK